MKLSIGMVCFPTFGGSGVIASELAAGLSSRGHQVHLIASASPVRAISQPEGFHFHLVKPPDYPLFTHPPYTPALASKIVDVSRSHGLDLLHLHYAVPHAASGYLAVRALGPDAPKMVISLHGTDVTKVGSDPSYLPITSFTVGEADGLTVPSRYLREEAHEKLGLPATREIEVIPNFVDTDEFFPADVRDRRVFRPFFEDDEEGPILFHVSNFRPVKRVVDLVEVLALVRKRLPAKMLLVGDGPDRSKAEARARELGLLGKVKFVGKRDDFGPLMRHADVFVLTSETESFCLAALESLSSGVPVCGYRVGGVPELVTDDVGRLVEPFDVDALAQAVIGVLVQPGVREQMGRAARVHVERSFRLDPAVDRYEAYFRKVMNREPG